MQLRVSEAAILQAGILMMTDDEVTSLEEQLDRVDREFPRESVVMAQRSGRLQHAEIDEVESRFEQSLAHCLAVKLVAAERVARLCDPGIEPNLPNIPSAATPTAQEIIKRAEAAARSALDEDRNHRGEFASENESPAFHDGVMEETFFTDEIVQ